MTKKSDLFSSLDINTRDRRGYYAYNCDNVEDLKKMMLRAVRLKVPKDTGNMRYNSVYVVNTINGFKIVFDKRFAFYMPTVNEGTQGYFTAKTVRNIGFVDRAILSGINAIITANGNIRKPKHLTDNKLTADMPASITDKYNKIDRRKNERTYITELEEYKDKYFDEKYDNLGRSKMFRKFRESIRKARENDEHFSEIFHDGFLDDEQ